MNVLIGILTTLISSSVSAKVYLAASYQERTDRLELSFLSNSAKEVTGRELIFVRGKESQILPQPFQLAPFSDLRLSIPRPAYIAISNLHEWKIRTGDEETLPAAISIITAPPETSVPPRWILKDKKLLIPEGTYVIPTSLVFDRDLDVTIGPNVVFLMGEDVSVFLRGRFAITGLTVKPAVPKKNWASLVLQGYDHSSTLQDVVIDGGTGGTVAGVPNSCALCLYGGKYSVRGLQVRHTLAEDGLNAKDVEMTLTDSLFSNTMSDAFDCDFCRLDVLRTNFSKIAGDGVDVSTSRTEVRESSFRGIGDKAISVGEGSQARILRNVIEGADIAVATKDASVALIKGNTFQGCRLDVAAYRKKEFWIKGGNVTLHHNQLNSSKKSKDEFSRFTELAL